MDYLDFAGAEDFGGYFDFGGVDFADLGGDILGSGFDLAGSLDVSNIQPFDSAVDSLTSSATGILGQFDLSKFLTGLAQTYVQYDLGRRALEQQGQRPPQQVTRPTPGTTRQLPGGSIARTNADGSTTVTSPNGQVRTVTPTGQVVQGASGGALGASTIIPGVPNVLVYGGAIGLAAVFLLRRRRS